MTIWFWHFASRRVGPGCFFFTARCVFARHLYVDCVTVVKHATVITLLTYVFRWRLAPRRIDVRRMAWHHRPAARTRRRLRWQLSRLGRSRHSDHDSCRRCDTDVSHWRWLVQRRRRCVDVVCAQEAQRSAVQSMRRRGLGIPLRSRLVRGLQGARFHSIIGCMAPRQHQRIASWWRFAPICDVGLRIDVNKQSIRNPTASGITKHRLRRLHIML